MTRVSSTYTQTDLRTVQSPPPAALKSLSDWTVYLESNSDKMPQEIYTEAREKQEVLWRLAKLVEEWGGWLRVTGQNRWKEVESSLKIEEAREEYETYLLPLEKRREFGLRYRYGNPFSLEVKLLKYHSIRPIPIFYPPTNGIIDDAFWTSVMSQDIAILRGFLDDVWPLNNSLFSISTVERTHGDEVFDALSQDREPDCCPNQVHLGSKAQISIKEYIAKMRKELQKGVEENTTVEFGINIDIGKWEEHMHELRKTLPKRLIFGSELDALDYVRSHIYGMTLPQIYLKVTGCWTGAHQENLNFAAININHGPGVCEWWGLDPHCTAYLRREVRERLDFDIHLSETLWWPDENFLMNRGYITYYGEQMHRDIVYVGPATMHWVKSLSPTVNSAWNIGQKDLKQFKYAFERDRMNHNINFESLVQIHTLSMDLLNSELQSLPEDLVQFLAQQLHTRWTKEQEQLSKFNLKRPKVMSEHQVYRCDKCKEEIFMVYATCSQCENEAYCLQCISLHDKSHERYRYCGNFEGVAMEALLKRVEMRKSDSEPLRKCYIPGLSQTYSGVEKYERLGVVCSPWTGSPDCLLFKDLREGGEEEVPDSPVRRTRQTGKPSKRTRASAKKPYKKRKPLEVEEVKAENMEEAGENEAESMKQDPVSEENSSFCPRPEQLPGQNAQFPSLLSEKPVAVPETDLGEQEGKTYMIPKIRQDPPKRKMPY